MNTPLTLFAFALYAGLAVYFWRNTWLSGQRGGEAVISPLFTRGAVALPLALHALLLQQTLFPPQGLALGVGAAVSAIIWLTIFIYWLANFRFNLEGLQALLLPVAALALLLQALLPEPHALQHTEVPGFKLHMLASLLAYSLLTVAAFHAALMALVEKRLHHHVMPVVLSGLPPLMTLEKLLFQLIWAGFILLTLALGSGILFSEELFGRPLQFSHKILFALLSWLVFAVLLIGRHAYGWRGKTAIRWTIAGFVMLLLAYLGSKFVLEVVLQRS